MKSFIAVSWIMWILVGCEGFGLSSDRDDDSCSGFPGGGYTLSPGPPIHDGYYSGAECAEICGPMVGGCAPVIEQRVQPRFRCGPAAPASCGPRHQPRPNVPGPCDSNGFDRDVSGLDGPAASALTSGDALACSLWCGAFVRRCSLSDEQPTRDVTRIRCGEPVPASCRVTDEGRRFPDLQSDAGATDH